MGLFETCASCQGFNRSPTRWRSFLTCAVRPKQDRRTDRTEQETASLTGCTLIRDDETHGSFPPEIKVFLTIDQILHLLPFGRWRSLRASSHSKESFK